MSLILNRVLWTLGSGFTRIWRQVPQRLLRFVRSSVGTGRSSDTKRGLCGCETRCAVLVVPAQPCSRSLWTTLASETELVTWRPSDGSALSRMI